RAGRRERRAPDAHSVAGSEHGADRRRRRFQRRRASAGVPVDPGRAPGPHAGPRRASELTTMWRVAVLLFASAALAADAVQPTPEEARALCLAGVAGSSPVDDALRASQA